MSFSAKLSLPARFFSHCFGSHGRTLNYFCNRLRTAKRYVTWLVSNHDRRIMSENSGVYIAMKSAVKAMNAYGFCITRVMDVLSVFTFSYLKCLHSWRSIWNFRKIFVTEGNSYIFFVPFSYEHFTFHVYSLSLKCRLVRFDCVDTNRANKNYQTWQRSLAVHFISSFINHKWHWKEI